MDMCDVCHQNPCVCEARKFTDLASKVFQETLSDWGPKIQADFISRLTKEMGVLFPSDLKVISDDVVIDMPEETEVQKPGNDDLIRIKTHLKKVGKPQAAKDIANDLGLTRKAVNQILHRNIKDLVKSKDARPLWSLPTPKKEKPEEKTSGKAKPALKLKPFKLVKGLEVDAKTKTYIFDDKKAFAKVDDDGNYLRLSAKDLLKLKKASLPFMKKSEREIAFDTHLAELLSDSDESSEVVTDTDSGSDSE